MTMLLKINLILWLETPYDKAILITSFISTYHKACGHHT